MVESLTAMMWSSPVTRDGWEGVSRHADCCQGQNRARHLSHQVGLNFAGAGLLHLGGRRRFLYPARMLKSLGGVLLALIAAFALAQDAEAKPRTVKAPGGQEAGFSVRASNGYAVYVSNFAGEVTVFAGQKQGKNVVLYLADRRDYGERGFEAKLPGVGRIAVEFRPRGQAMPIPVPRSCSGRPGSEQKGFFVGTIELHGEHGFTEVTASRARGTVTRTYPQTCKLPRDRGKKDVEPKTDDEPETAMLIATDRKAGLSFSATRFDFGGDEGPAVLIFSAISFEERRGMTIFRMVRSFAPLKTFSAAAPGAPSTATVEPPAPFTGSASYSLGPDGSPSWTGNLSVPLPGGEPARLAGKRFESQLCIGADCSGEEFGPSGSPSIAVSVISQLAR